MTIPNIQATKSRLHHSLSLIESAGVATPHVECGRETFGFLLDIVVADAPLEEAWKLRTDLEEGRACVKFRGVLVKRCHDVPEWSLWPPREISVLATQRRMKADTQEVPC